LTLGVHGRLAEFWGISKDGLIYNITLRSVDTWHDGTP
jgi:ABC-type transport system substrate-binding protein